MNRYKAVVSNKSIYREIELLPENKHLVLGTEKGCDVRLNSELFFEPFEVLFENDGENWSIACGENCSITTDGIVKLTGKTLEHGDTVTLKSRSTNQEILVLNYVLDFGYENQDYERVIDITDAEVITIGGSPDCDIYISDSIVENDIVVLEKRGGKIQLTAKKAKYGLYINGDRAGVVETLGDYNFFSIVGYSFYYKYGKLYTSKNTPLSINGLPNNIEAESTSRFIYPKFNRSTRIQFNVNNEEIPLLEPPEAPTKQEQNIVMSLIPTLAMLFVTIFIRGQMGGGGAFIYISAITMGIGVVTSIITYITQGRKYRKDSKKRIEDYTKYIEDKRTYVNEKRQHEREALEEVYYSPKREMDLVRSFSPDLFNRTERDEDFLHLRVGTGSLPSRQPIAYKEQERFEIEDELVDMPVQLAQETTLLSKAPITVDCANNNAIGIVGSRQRLYEFMKNTLLDFTTRQYYSDIQLFFMVSEENADKISWIRFLPHLQNEALDMRNIVCDEDSKNILFEYLYKELSAREEAGCKTPNIIIFVYDDIGIKSHPLSNYILKANDCGVTFVFFEEHKEELPIGCDEIIELKSGETSGRVVSSKDETQQFGFSYEPIDDLDAAYFVQKLAPIYCEEISLEGSLTKNISFFELLDILSVNDINLAERWATSEIYKSMAAPLGVRTGDELVSLDLHEKYHGPHGLVAGTTGSGKSEILQSYILSMATLFHPYEVGFVIIDFKGGGMVNQFKDLPHLVGAITNIDGREIDRSLLSIKAELRKRQAIFSEYNVNHIDAYIKLFKRGEAKQPMPHLILIVDEFAELKQDQPEFMKELISAARIGRSLGVHLILATQKPSGVVDAQIWSNSKFKLCLKVQTKEDSNEVLKTPLAAEIKEPGRAYLQVGNNEIFELFQSAYSGALAVNNADAVKKFSVYSRNLAGRKSLVYEQKPEKGDENSLSQLEAVVDYVAQYCEQNKIEQLPGICLPPLREMIPFEEAQKPAGKDVPFSVALGVYDDPNNQLQAQVDLDFLSGNTFIMGAAQTGKTAMLQLVLRGIVSRYAPSEINAYVLDFGSMALKIFDDFNHVGGVVTASNEDGLKTVFRMIEREIATRRDKFAKLGITSFASYYDAGYRDLPCIVLLLDNMTSFRDLYPDYEEQFAVFCREGVTVGISIVATATQMRGMSYKYLSSFPNRIALHCNQRDDYTGLFDYCRIEPKNVPGRAIIQRDKELFEYQNYLAFEGEREIERVESIRQLAKEINKKYNGDTARMIPTIPDLLTVDYLNDNFPDKTPYAVAAGIRYDTVEAEPLDLAHMGHLAISGRKEGGKTNFVQYLFRVLDERIKSEPVEAYIFDGYARQLQSLEKHEFVKQYATDLDSLNDVLTKMGEEADRRRQLLRTAGLSALDSLPLLLVVVQNNQFTEKEGLSSIEADSCQKLMKAGKELKMLFIFADIENAAIAYGSSDILKYIKDNKNILFFDSIHNLKLIDLPMAEVRSYRKNTELGDAFYLLDDNVLRIKTPCAN